MVRHLKEREPRFRKDLERCRATGIQDTIEELQSWANEVNNSLPIRVHVPICAFRPYASREYQDTFPFPAPSVVYGMLLSLLGIPRDQKGMHRGTEMALAVESLPTRSKVFRKLRRGLDLENTRPDYQDLLMDLTLWVWLRPGTDSASPSLAESIPAALAQPERINRFGVRWARAAT